MRINGYYIVYQSAATVSSITIRLHRYYAAISTLMSVAVAA